MTGTETETLVDWAAAEGWNPGLRDAGIFGTVDAAGFLGAFVGGEMVAGISAAAYDDAFGFIGLYICRPDMRGRGHGKAVWDAGMAHLGQRTIGLDGVPEQQANYRSMGFEVAYETVRYSGILQAGPRATVDIRHITPALGAAVTAFDRLHFPAPRARFLRHWLERPHAALASVPDGRLRGYGVARACREGWKIGPLFAESHDVAIGLMTEFAACSGGAPVHVDVPASNGAFAAVLSEAGLAPGFRTARMYRGPAPRLRQECVFAITTLELG